MLYNYNIENRSNRNPAQTLQEEGITAFGPRLHNWLTSNLRDMISVKIKKFKLKVEKFIEFIPDDPKIPNHANAARNNSILDHLSHRRAHGICNGGGVSAGLTPAKPLQVYQESRHNQH